MGEGTSGKVRRAIHIETGKPFAIKCLDKQQIEHQNMGAQLKREIAVMKMIQSKHIVQFYECLASKSNVYLVLELVTGGELFELLVKEGRFSEGRARFFFQQLVEVVQCCHKKGVAHRDLEVVSSRGFTEYCCAALILILGQEPENLLLDSNEELMKS
jgi:serine/threonine protein kinase